MPNEDRLLSVGIDIGTTTIHLVVTSLKFGNLARPTYISEPKITDKQVLFSSPVCETPLSEDGRIDAEAVAKLIENFYEQAALAANLDMNSVQTGAVIITGESARTRNAPEVLLQVAKFAGEFVVESAGPGLESILCARGSGAQALSKDKAIPVLSLDIGGGTSNFAFIEGGEITATGAVSIGGKAITFEGGKILHLSKTASLLCQKLEIDLKVGMAMGDCLDNLVILAGMMAHTLAVLCRPRSRSIKFNNEFWAETWAETWTEIGDEIWLTPPLFLEEAPELVLLSGGVAKLMQEEPDDLLKHQDFGVYLALTLNQTLLDRQIAFAIARDAIRATVLGAGMHTLQLTGSTIGFDEDLLPLRNIPLIKVEAGDQKDLVAKISKALALRQLDWSSQPVVLALTGLQRNLLQYPKVKQLAASLALAQEQLRATEPLIVTVDQDIAMALGLLLKRLLPDKRIISVDGIVVQDGDYLDIGKPIHSDSLSDTCTQTLPVVVKTLIFYKN